MYLIVGLGNPGKEYENTRHNVGFDVVDMIGKKYNIDINREKFNGAYGEGIIEGEKVILLKPLTYMNLSGESVRGFVNFYKLNSENVIVIHDDISLEVGRLRIRGKGSAGGHNGMKNIILNLGTDLFTRVKIGVGQPQGGLVSHVLGKFVEDDRKLAEKTFEEAIPAVECIIKQGITSAMNSYNSFKVEK